MKRLLTGGGSAFAALAVVGFGWFYADALRQDALDTAPAKPEYNLVVDGVDRTAGTITLRTGDGTDLDHGDWRHPGTFGVISQDAAGVVGDIVSRDDASVVRTLATPEANLDAGDRVNLTSRVWLSDPRAALGIAFEDVTFDSDIGTLGAWLIPGAATTWAIYVHGRGIGREEGLRILPTLVDLGLPTLMIQYRNDAGVPASADGRHAYGLSEWRDVEAAVRYAHAAGAGDVILVGSSMGGGIVAGFLLESELAGSASGAILDSPALDFGDIVDYGAARRGLWSGLTWLGKTTAALRFGLDWNAFDYVARADAFDVPILLVHGDADRTVHVRTSDALAAARPDLVTYVRPEGIGHVRAWNADPAAYEAAVRDFVNSVLALAD